MRRLVQAQVSALFINSPSVDDLSFLRELPLTELDITRMAPGTRIDPVNDVPTLTRLNLASGYKGSLDATHLTRLRECFLEWGPGAESIATCESLQYLYVNNFPERTLRAFEALIQLRVLRVGNAKSLQSLDGLQGLAGLRAAAVYRCPRLLSISALPRTSLVRFEAETCRRVTDWELLAKAARLKHIGLKNVGPVPSITPFAQVPTIEFFWFPDDTLVEDGQVRWLCDVATLRATGFRNRRHYDATAADVDAVITGRHGPGEWYPPKWHDLVAP